MVNHNKKTFEVDTWSDVFDEVSLTKLPFKYIDTILINFKDKTTWELGITSTHTPKELESFEDGFKEILQDGGYRGLYRGFHFALMRAIPLHATAFATMEFCKKYLE